jgi:hypothetical protein
MRGDKNGCQLMELNFSLPWSVVEATGEFCVRDATGRTLLVGRCNRIRAHTGRGEAFGGPICQGGLIISPKSATLRKTRLAVKHAASPR